MQTEIVLRFIWKTCPIRCGVSLFRKERLYRHTVLVEDIVVRILKTCANDTIRCVFDGVVRMAKHYGGYGKVIVVRHDNGIETIYSHNSKNMVAAGDTVKAGQPIALTGRTGRATTEHLHFEIRINGQHLNPGLLFDMKTGNLLKRTLVCTKTGNHVKLVPKK